MSRVKADVGGIAHTELELGLAQLVQCAVTWAQLTAAQRSAVHNLYVGVRTRNQMIKSRKSVLRGDSAKYVKVV